MAGCVSFQIPCDPLLNCVSNCFCRKVNYIRNLNKNLAALTTAMEQLSAAREDVLRKVQSEETNGLRRRLAVVQVWISKVQSIENEFKELHTACLVELQRLCLCGLRSKYRYGKKVLLMLEKVNLYLSEKVFEVVTDESCMIDVVEVKNLQPEIVGQTTMLEKAWNHLMDDGTNTMGLYGMGGVGKTTLLKQINNKISGGFDTVIWIVVSKDNPVLKIQDGIAEKLGLCGREWDRKTEDQKANGIHNSMRHKRFVLLLDDIWSKVDLMEIGVPFPTMENRSKIIFTTRSKEVCGRMEVHDPIEVKCLGPDDAWDLFRNKVGKITLESHPGIADLALKVAEKCQGLPLALNIVGETMACQRTVEEWEKAVKDLSSYAAELPGMDQILPILMYSYDNLKEKHVKSCFLYCALFPEDFQIDKDKLIDYWICEGFVSKKVHGEGAINQGYEILRTLERGSLLMEGLEDKSYVTMHDIVREMALWIASDHRGVHKDTCLVQAGIGLCEVPGDEDWEAVTRMSLIQNKIEQISSSPNCPQLTTLFLQENYKLVNISREFFLSMPRLVVLDLSWNQTLDSLPEAIEKLVSLRYLDLSRTRIKLLPFGLQKLKLLIHLNLEFMIRLESISGISHLSSLRTLKLKDSKLSADINTVKELELLKCLEVLTIDIASSLAVEQLLQAPRLVRCIKYISMAMFDEESLALPTMSNLRDIMIQSCGMGEIKIKGTTPSWIQSFTTPCFLNLSKVSIQQCNGLKDLTWLLFAPNLTRLKVKFSKELEDIISKEKVANATELETGIIVPFQKLQHIELLNLPMLNSIFKTPLPFPELRYITVRNTPKLKKFPLDSQSVAMVEKLVIYYCEEEWSERLEWEDEATRSRFLPSFKLW